LIGDSTPWRRGVLFFVLQLLRFRLYIHIDIGSFNHTHSFETTFTTPYQDLPHQLASRLIQYEVSKRPSTTSPFYSLVESSFNDPIINQKEHHQNAIQIDFTLAYIGIVEYRINQYEEHARA